MSTELVMPSNHLILCYPLLLPSIFPSFRVFSNELAPLIRWPNYWRFSFSLSPSNEYSGFISFRIDPVWSPCSPRDSQESSPAPQFKSIKSLALSLLYGPALTSVHDYWVNNSIIQSSSQQHYYKVGPSITIPLWQMRKLSYVAIARFWCRSWLQSRALDHYATCLMNTGMPREMILLSK